MPRPNGGKPKVKYEVSISHTDNALVGTLCEMKNIEPEELLAEVLEVYLAGQRQQLYPTDGMRVQCQDCAAIQFIGAPELYDGWRCRNCLSELKPKPMREYGRGGDDVVGVEVVKPLLLPDSIQ